VIPSRLVLATANPGKVAEIGALVAAWGVEVVPLSAFPAVAVADETAATYVENAVAKARAVAAGTGLPALADDSGLEVDALDGAPGVRSARWAGADTDDARRNARLLAALAGVAPAERGATFRCVVALAWPDGCIQTAEGRCRGRIAEAASGAGGFGYDPLFVADEVGATFAAAPPEAKARFGHRARAVRALGEALGVRVTLRGPGGAC
jgi:XTP/dITP diphosphohydrolase